MGLLVIQNLSKISFFEYSTNGGLTILPIHIFSSRFCFAIFTNRFWVLGKIELVPFKFVSSLPKLPTNVSAIEKLNRKQQIFHHY